MKILTLSVLAAYAVAIIAGGWIVRGVGLAEDKPTVLDAVSNSFAVSGSDSTVIARINDVEITEASLSPLATAIQESSTVGLTAEESRSLALERMVRDELLLQEARRRDLWPSQPEVDEFVRMYFEKLNKADSSQRDEVFRLYSVQGLDLATLNESVAFVDAVASGMALASIKSQIVSGVPFGDSAAVQALIHEAVMSAAKNSEVVINIQTNSEFLDAVQNRQAVTP